MAKDGTISGRRLKSMVPALVMVIDRIQLPVPDKDRTSGCDDMDALCSLLCVAQGSALNMAGLLRVYIRSVDELVYAIDPRFRSPADVEVFRRLMARLARGECVFGEHGERLIKGAKKLIGQNLPAGMGCVTVKSGGSDAFGEVLKAARCVFIALDPTQGCEDEHIVARFDLPPMPVAMMAAEFVREAERSCDIW